MAKLGEHRYYKRSGDSFYRMEHFDIQDMFGRRKRADLHISCKVDLRATEMDGASTQEISFRLVNSGRAVARYWGLFCEFDARIKILNTFHPVTDLTSLNDGRPVVSCQDNNGVIHPNGIGIQVGKVIIRREDEAQTVADVTVDCEGTQTKKIRLEIPSPIQAAAAPAINSP
jgi:hypothetical protein